VWLSNEVDACFLHTLDVGEDDFAGLKAQQGILVDFGGFPNKLIALLDRCAAAAAEHQPPRCCVCQL
jgi:spindle assembly abnormal protein 6